MPDRYEIKERVGRGGIGAVYRAHDHILGRDVAIKRLLPIEQTHLNELDKSSLSREAAALAKLQHPNIVTVFSFEEDDEGPFVVMEFIGGETLKEVISKGALTFPDFDRLVEQMLDALVTAHELNLLHRDIKPGNIMLHWLTTGKFQAKILDFGLAKFSQTPSLQTLDQTGSFLGSIDYIAPEQIELKPLDPRTDLYSLGCVLYFCLNQKPPFEGENAALTMENHLKHRVKPIKEIRDDLPPAVADWVMWMISREPEDRPSSARMALEAYTKAKQGTSPLPEDPTLGSLSFTQAGAAGEKPAPPARGPSGPRPHITSPRRPEAKPDSQSIRPRTGSQQPQRSKPGSSSLRPHTSTNPSRSGSSRVRPHTSPENAPTTSTSPSSYVLKEPARNRSSKIWIGMLAVAVVAGVAAMALVTGGNLPGGGFANIDHEARFATLPFTSDHLKARYQAEHGLFQMEENLPAAAGDTVGLWQNAAPGAAPSHRLEKSRDRKDSLPQLETVGPEKFSYLSGPLTALHFSQKTMLITTGKNPLENDLRGAQLTVSIVFKSEGGRGNLLYLDEPGSTNGTIAIGYGPRSYFSGMMVDGRRIRLESKMPKNQFMILTYVWNGDAGTQQQFIALHNGKRFDSPVGLARKGTLNLTRYHLGAIPGGKSPPNLPVFAGYVLELNLFDRALEKSEILALEEYALRRYFPK